MAHLHTGKEKQLAGPSNQPHTRQVSFLLKNLQPRGQGRAVEMPKMLQLSRFLQLVRQKRRVRLAEISHTNKQQYAASDFEFRRGRLNAGVGGGTSLLSNDVRLVLSDPQLRCVDLVLSNSFVCCPLISPKLYIVYDLGAIPTAMEFESFDGWNVQAVVQWVHAHYSRHK